MDIILLIVNEWDPIGFFPMAPKDEYISEVKKIYRYLNVHKNVTERELAEKINEIFLKSFGSDVYIEDTERCLNVAKDIISNQKKKCWM